MTPMMQQYFEIKEKYKEYILMYRLGDFYEMFFDDAKIAAKELELVLTGRDCGEEERAPMCGVPYHAVDGYIGKLVSHGYKVAICEQMEDPSLAKGIVKRDVVRMITPGTLTESSLLDEKKNNYICAVYLGDGAVGVSFADISTGSLSATEFSGSDMMSRLFGEMGVYAPREVVINTAASGLGEIETFLRERLGCTINENQEARFSGEDAKREALSRFAGEAVPAEFNDENDPALKAVGALISYALETQKNDLSNLRSLNFYREGQYLEMDINTRRNLETCESQRRGEKHGTLLWVLDRTKTAAGARLLKNYIDFPLSNPYGINRRQSAVAELCGDVVLRGELENALKGVLDLERIMTRVVYGSAGGRDLRALAQTTEKLPQIKGLLSSCECEELASMFSELDTLSDVTETINAAIVDDPPFSVREGGIIRDGYNADIDYLRSVISDSKGWIERIEEAEKKATGIKTLKVGYNRVFGYYIEVSKSFIGNVPERFIRKQTLANGERYITQELKDMESQMLGASDKITALEYQLFTEVRLKIAENVHRIQKTAFILAKLDVYRSLAEVACRNGYCRPEITYGDEIIIKDGRHPVVEQFAKDSYFVPNDTNLDGGKNRFMLITGPNMAGKSTYMRQTALICLMAQIGSFVPAREARIGVIDKLFTRVGASDDLAMGQSTFMLEMSEVAYILSHATKRSLIIYDEIGRGTSTFDGMSIARAVAEYTLGKKVGAKTLFATHYHELTGMESEFEGIVNYNIAAKKKGDDIVFLRKIVRGAADDSYGIEVAKLAGVPKEVTKRAKEILETLEAGGIQKKERTTEPADDDFALSFDNISESEVAEKLRAVDINTLTPLEAINLIYELKKMLS
ncbi:MAG: DNA mismatch repair protein MutS [Eubacteriales bacterium]|nr:DNA mismatch repair protein MutS [Eubacterium sp.]MDY5354950.1 DNA mismatch repair protein MutS [Eubacteriales bacterium]